VKYWEIFASNLLSKAGWSRGCVSAVDCTGRVMLKYSLAGGKRTTKVLLTPVSIYLKLGNLNPGSGQERLFLSVLSSSFSDRSRRVNHRGK
jgi:hypothetical protein